MSGAGQLSPVDRASLDAFLAARCRFGKGARVSVSGLFRAFEAWRAQAGLAPLTRIRLARAMLERGYQTKLSGEIIYVDGLELVDAPTQVAP